MESALQDAENFRQRVRGAEYDATMRVQEWDGRGRLRGTAKAVAIMRPGDLHPMTFISREVHGKVRLPDEKDRSKEDEKITEPSSILHANTKSRSASNLNSRAHFRRRTNLVAENSKMTAADNR